MKAKVGIVCLLVLASFAFGQPRKHRVPKDYPNIQTAINFAEDGDVVVVSDGVWTGAGNKNIGFRGLAITVRSKNGPQNCIIDCEGNGRGFKFQSNETKKSVLNGFTITNGNVQGEPWTNAGGGIYCDDSGPTITNCIIIGNKATGFGGGIVCSDSKPIIINCMIIGNMSGWEGGGVFLYWSRGTRIINCLIAENTAGDPGGGIQIGGSDRVKITNSILWNNKPEQIACGLFARPTVSFSNIQNGWPGRHNIDADPLFTTGPLGEYYLSHKKAGQEQNSPCRNAGLGTAKELGLKKTTTRTDGKRDRRAVDMGWHYAR